jgi:hypothetical protein
LYCAVAEVHVDQAAFACHYESAILYGRAVLIADEEEIVRTLGLLNERFSDPQAATFESQFAEHVRAHGRGAAMLLMTAE